MDEIIERIFEVNGAARLKIGNIRGKIIVQEGGNDEILVQAVKHTNTGDAERTEIDIRQESDGRVVVETRFDKALGFLTLNWPCKVSYTVTVPHDCSVVANGVSCEINLSNLSGELKVNSVSGAVRLADLGGDMDISSVSGRIRARNLAGPLKISSVSGSMRVENSELTSVRGSTTSGKVVVQTPLAEGPYKFNSVSGNVTVMIPEGSGCEARLKAVSGRLKTSLPYTSRQRHKFRDHAYIQGGGPLVSCNAVSGNLRIVTSESDRVKAVKRASINPQPIPKPKSNLEILNQVEKGELTAEEALIKLN